MTIEQVAYQVRFDWGLADVEAVGADADVVVWVDAIATVPPPDHLAAGSVISHLGALGIDATSPEVATAEAAYRHLERALGHLVSAGVTGRAAAVRPAAFRVDEALGAGAVVVRRPQPDSGSAAVSRG